jgi:hypothetical protein
MPSFGFGAVVQTGPGRTCGFRVANPKITGFFELCLPFFSERTSTWPHWFSGLSLKGSKELLLFALRGGRVNGPMTALQLSGRPQIV